MNLNATIGNFGVAAYPAKYSKLKLNCSWTIPVDSNGSSVLFVLTSLKLSTEATANEQLSVYDGAVIAPSQVLFNPRDYNGSKGTVNNNEILVNFRSEVMALSDVHGSFFATYYVDFCSVNDGTLVLPSTTVWNNQNLPLISSDYFSSMTSEARNYRPASTCVYDFGHAMKPGPVYTLVFYTFDLGNGDSVKVMDGTNTAAWPVFTKVNPPAPLQVKYPLYYSLVFKSDSDASVGNGFEADILQDTCSSRVVSITTLSGTFTDGTAKNTLYNRGLTCPWLFQPMQWSTGGYTELRVNYMSLGPEDNLTVYDTPDNTGNILFLFSGRYNDTTAASIVVKISSPSFFVEFKTSSRSQGWYTDGSPAGFSLNWTACSGPCLRCKAGEYFDFTTQQCLGCVKPYQSQSSAALRCDLCPQGSEWVSTSSCRVCGNDTYWDANHKFDSACQKCGPQTVADEPGLLACKPCPDNSIANHTSSTCSPCPEGTRADSTSKHHDKEDTCVTIPVPQNNVVIIVFVFVGLGVLAILGGLLAWLYNRRKQQDDGWGSYSMVN
jgi:hypothetical protein